MSEDTDDGDFPNDKSFVIFGRDISQIPCFRSSFLYGISGGIGAGFGTFLFTSRTRLSSHVGMTIFCLTTLVYWTQCRYNWSQRNFEYKQLKRGMQDYAMYEGTELAKEVQKRGVDT